MGRVTRNGNRFLQVLYARTMRPGSEVPASPNRPRPIGFRDVDFTRRRGDRRAAEEMVGCLRSPQPRLLLPPQVSSSSAAPRDFPVSLPRETPDSSRPARGLRQPAAAFPEPAPLAEWFPRRRFHAETRRSPGRGGDGGVPSVSATPPPSPSASLLVLRGSA